MGSAAQTSRKKSSRWETWGGRVCAGDIELMRRQTMQYVQVGLGLSGRSAVFASSGRAGGHEGKSRQKKDGVWVGENPEQTGQQDKTGKVESRSGQVRSSEVIE